MWLFFLILSSVVSLSFAASAHSEDVLRTALLDNLSPSKTNTLTDKPPQIPVQISQADSVQNSHAHLGVLGHDIFRELLNFLSASDLINTSSTCTEYYNYVNEFIHFRLWYINPKFATNQRIANSMLYTFLSDSEFLDVPIKADYLELLTYKIVSNDQNSQFISRLPESAQKTICSFLHEIVYGPQASTLPYDRNEWQVNFIQKLNYIDNLFAAAIFYRDTLIDRVAAEKNINGKIIPLWKGSINIFYTRPDKVILDLMIRWDEVDLLRRSNILAVPVDIACGLITLISPYITEAEDWHFAISCMISTNSFSQYFWDAVSDQDDILITIFENRSRINVPRWNKELVKKFLANNVIGLDYLLSRDSANPFNLEELTAMNPDMRVLMKEFLYCATPNLTEQEIFVQIFRAGLFPDELVEQARNHVSGFFAQILDIE